MADSSSGAPQHRQPDGAPAAASPLRCPDCGQGTVQPGDRCPVCLLAWEDIEAGADLAVRAIAARRADAAHLTAMMQGSVPRDIAD